MILVFRLVLGAMFLLGAAGKLVDIEHYSVALVYNFGILPGPIAIAFGWALPFIELGCALALIFGLLARLASLGLALMSISFFVVKAVLLARWGDVECGCFGAIGSTMASWSIYLDPAVFLMSLAILLAPDSSRLWVSLAKRLPETWRRRLALID